MFVPGAGLPVANTETAAMPNGARHDVAPCDRAAISRSSGTKKPNDLTMGARASGFHGGTPVLPLKVCYLNFLRKDLLGQTRS
jgi:hypothetical protein